MKPREMLCYKLNGGQHLSSENAGVHITNHVAKKTGTV